MIVLDTNVLSELMRAEPDPSVLAWLSQHPNSGLFTTTLSQAEIYYGLRLLPDGKRRDGLQGAADAMFEEDFARRVLPFDIDAAVAYAEIAADRKIAGSPISQFDAQIAAVAKSRGAKLATRNVRDFADCGVVIVNPWTDE